MAGSLTLIATPIGNLEDISIRAIKTLGTVDIILCEDTRRTGNLFAELKKTYPAFFSNHKPKLVSYYDQIEEKRIPEIITVLEEGKQIALVCDSGTPTISDPGFCLVREVRKRNLPVTAIPGPVAGIVALSLSGLPVHHFTFLGFLPEKSTSRINILKRTRHIPSTYIVYCPPHKLKHTLGDMLEVFGDKTIVLARELTKIHEEVKTDTIAHLMEYAERAQGECVLLWNFSA